MFDVTFHPIKEEELRELIFRPAINSEGGFNKIKDLVIGDDYKGNLDKFFVYFLTVIKEAPEVKNFDSVTWACAALAGFLHPYWWGKDTALKYLPNFEHNFAPFIKSVYDVAPEFLPNIEIVRPPVLNDSYAGGGFIPASAVPEFRQILSQVVTAQTDFDVITWSNLVFALEYAEKNNCGLLETSGVFDCIKGCLTKGENLRTGISRMNFPVVAISLPDTEDWEKQVEVFLKGDPAEYKKFVLAHLAS
ncbi:MAG: hypothetical protein V1716_04690 [Candidatus Uhrbacteria bacterium]